MRLAALAFAAAVAVPATSAPQFMGGMDPGEFLFGECRDCHTFEAGAPHGRKGPNLWGVFGRPAGTAPGYDYSPQLKASGIVWTETTVEKWLRNPQTLVPGTKMDFQMPTESQRELVLEYMRNADIEGYVRALRAMGG